MKSCTVNATASNATILRNRCSFLFFCFLSFGISIIKKKLAKHVFKFSLSMSVLCKNEENGEGKQQSLHTPVLVFFHPDSRPEIIVIAAVFKHLSNSKHNKMLILSQWRRRTKHDAVLPINIYILCTFFFFIKWEVCANIQNKEKREALPKRKSDHLIESDSNFNLVSPWLVAPLEKDSPGKRKVPASNPSSSLSRFFFCL